jgi:RyR domain
MPTVPQIAEVCHGANRAYCQSIGDNSQPEWNEAPEWQKQSAITGVNFHLAVLNTGNEPPASASHESWLAEKERDGWKYGPTKNPETKEHPCFVPYDQLPVEQRLKDYIFGAIVKAYFDCK